MLMRLLERIRGATPPTISPAAPPPGRRAFLLEMLPKQSVGAEIGVHEGRFSAEILRVADPVRLHLIDPWKHEGSETYAGALYGGSAPGGQAQMDERYEAVRRRFGADPRVRLAFRKTKRGGYVTGDDYGEGGWWRGGVKKAVDELVRAAPVELVVIRNDQFVLRT